MHRVLTLCANQVAAAAATFHVFLLTHKAPEQTNITLLYTSYHMPFFTWRAAQQGSGVLPEHALSRVVCLCTSAGRARLRLACKAGDAAVRRSITNLTLTVNNVPDVSRGSPIGPAGGWVPACMFVVSGCEPGAR